MTSPLGSSGAYSINNNSNIPTSAQSATSASNCVPASAPFNHNHNNINHNGQINGFFRQTSDNSSNSQKSPLGNTSRLTTSHSFVSYNGNITQDTNQINQMSQINQLGLGGPFSTSLSQSGPTSFPLRSSSSSVGSSSSTHMNINTNNVGNNNFGTMSYKSGDGQFYNNNPNISQNNQNNQPFFISNSHNHQQNQQNQHNNLSPLSPSASLPDFQTLHHASPFPHSLSFNILPDLNVNTDPQLQIPIHRSSSPHNSSEKPNITFNNPPTGQSSSPQFQFNTKPSSATSSAQIPLHYNPSSRATQNTPQNLSIFSYPQQQSPQQQHDRLGLSSPASSLGVLTPASVPRRSSNTPTMQVATIPHGVQLATTPHGLKTQHSGSPGMESQTTCILRSSSSSSRGNNNNNNNNNQSNASNNGNNVSQCPSVPSTLKKATFNFTNVLLNLKKEASSGKKSLHSPGNSQFDSLIIPPQEDLIDGSEFGEYSDLPNCHMIAPNGSVFFINNGKIYTKNQNNEFILDTNPTNHHYIRMYFQSMTSLNSTEDYVRQSPPFEPQSHSPEQHPDDGSTKSKKNSSRPAQKIAAALSSSHYNGAAAPPNRTAERRNRAARRAQNTNDDYTEMNDLGSEFSVSSTTGGNLSTTTAAGLSHYDSNYPEDRPPSPSPVLQLTSSVKNVTKKDDNNSNGLKKDEATLSVVPALAITRKPPTGRRIVVEHADPPLITNISAGKLFGNWPNLAFLNQINANFNNHKMITLSSSITNNSGNVKNQWRFQLTRGGLISMLRQGWKSGQMAKNVKFFEQLLHRKPIHNFDIFNNNYLPCQNSPKNALNNNFTPSLSDPYNLSYTHQGRHNQFPPHFTPESDVSATIASQLTNSYRFDCLSHHFFNSFFPSLSAVLEPLVPSQSALSVAHSMDLHGFGYLQYDGKPNGVMVQDEALKMLSNGTNIINFNPNSVDMAAFQLEVLENDLILKDFHNQIHTSLASKLDTNDLPQFVPQKINEFQNQQKSTQFVCQNFEEFVSQNYQTVKSSSQNISQKDEFSNGQFTQLSTLPLHLRPIYHRLFQSTCINLGYFQFFHRNLYKHSTVLVLGNSTNNNLVISITNSPRIRPETNFINSNQFNLLSNYHSYTNTCSDSFGNLTIMGQFDDMSTISTEYIVQNDKCLNGSTISKPDLIESNKISPKRPLITKDLVNNALTGFKYINPVDWTSDGAVAYFLRRGLISLEDAQNQMLSHLSSQDLLLAPLYHLKNFADILVEQKAQEFGIQCDIGGKYNFDEAVLNELTQLFTKQLAYFLTTNWTNPFNLIPMMQAKERMFERFNQKSGGLLSHYENSQTLSLKSQQSIPISNIFNNLPPLPPNIPYSTLGQSLIVPIPYQDDILPIQNDIITQPSHPPQNIQHNLINDMNLQNLDCGEPIPFKPFIPLKTRLYLFSCLGGVVPYLDSDSVTTTMVGSIDDGGYGSTGAYAPPIVGSKVASKHPETGLSNDISLKPQFHQVQNPVETQRPRISRIQAYRNNLVGIFFRVLFQFDSIFSRLYQFVTRYMVLYNDLPIWSRLPPALTQIMNLGVRCDGNNTNTEPDNSMSDDQHSSPATSGGEVFSVEKNLSLFNEITRQFNHLIQNLQYFSSQLTFSIENFAFEAELFGLHQDTFPVLDLCSLHINHYHYNGVLPYLPRFPSKSVMAKRFVDVAQTLLPTQQFKRYYYNVTLKNIWLSYKTSIRARYVSIPDAPDAPDAPLPQIQFSMVDIEQESDEGVDNWGNVQNLEHFLKDKSENLPKSTPQNCENEMIVAEHLKQVQLSTQSSLVINNTSDEISPISKDKWSNIPFPSNMNSLFDHTHATDPLLTKQTSTEMNLNDETNIQNSIQGGGGGDDGEGAEEEIENDENLDQTSLYYRPYPIYHRINHFVLLRHGAAFTVKSLRSRMYLHPPLLEECFNSFDNSYFPTLVFTQFLFKTQFDLYLTHFQYKYHDQYSNNNNNNNNNSNHSIQSKRSEKFLRYEHLFFPKINTGSYTPTPSWFNTLNIGRKLPQNPIETQTIKLFHSSIRHLIQSIQPQLQHEILWQNASHRNDKFSMLKNLPLETILNSTPTQLFQNMPKMMYYRHFIEPGRLIGHNGYNYHLQLLLNLSRYEHQNEQKLNISFFENHFDNNSSIFSHRKNTMSENNLDDQIDHYGGDYRFINKLHNGCYRQYLSQASIKYRPLNFLDKNSNSQNLSKLPNLPPSFSTTISGIHTSPTLSSSSLSSPIDSSSYMKTKSMHNSDQTMAHNHNDPSPMSSTSTISTLNNPTLSPPLTLDNLTNSTFAQQPTNGIAGRVLSHTPSSSGDANDMSTIQLPLWSFLPSWDFGTVQPDEVSQLFCLSLEPVLFLQTILAPLFSELQLKLNPDYDYGQVDLVQ
jgi:hypothetical protein